MPDDPLILSAALDPASAATLQRLRDRHFPPRLNIVPVHLTLFHTLPGAHLTAIRATLAAVCAAQGTMSLSSRGPRFLGRGVAIDIEAPGLHALRQRLAGSWRAWLTAQDRQPFRPHVTIQNKAEIAAARALLVRLEGEEGTVAGTVVGLDLWFYRGGPWEPAAHYAFGETVDAP